MAKKGQGAAWKISKLLIIRAIYTSYPTHLWSDLFRMVLLRGDGEGGGDGGEKGGGGGGVGVPGGGGNADQTAESLQRTCHERGRKPS